MKNLNLINAAEYALDRLGKEYSSSVQNYPQRVEFFKRFKLLYSFQYLKILSNDTFLLCDGKPENQVFPYQLVIL